MMDLDLDSCWKESLEFHATELADKLENFYSALLHVEYWRSINDKTNKSPDLEENVINKTTDGIRPKNELSNDDIHAVLMGVLQKVSPYISKILFACADSPCCFVFSTCIK